MQEYAKFLNILKKAITAFNHYLQSDRSGILRRARIAQGEEPLVDDTSAHHAKDDHFHTLDSTLKNQFEQAFDADFSDVKIHLGHYAEQLTRNAHADALTIGNNIYFADGKYFPETEEGAALLAHELQHIVQRNRNDRFVYLEDVAEAEAEAGQAEKEMSKLELYRINKPLLKQAGKGEIDREENERNRQESATGSIQAEDPGAGGLDDFLRRRDFPLIRVLTSQGSRYDLTRRQYLAGKEEIKRLFNEHLQEVKDSLPGNEYAVYMQKVFSYLQHL